MDVLRDDGERLLRVRQREEVVQVGGPADAPRQMLGHEARLDAIDQRPEPARCRASRRPSLPSESPTPWSETG